MIFLKFILMKRKQILGSFFKTVERDDADLLKVINKRVKLEKDRLEKMFETTKNLDKLEAYFQRSRRSLVVMLEDRGINFFSEKQKN